MATSVIRSPRYWGHFFWPPGKTTIHFLWKKKKNPRQYGHLVNTAKCFWPIGDRINRVPYQNFRNRQLLPNFKGPVEKLWRPTIFCQTGKSFVHWHLSLVRSSSKKNFLQLTFLVIRKISRLICEQGCKNEKLVIIFRPNANKASVRFKRLP